VRYIAAGGPNQMVTLMFVGRGLAGGSEVAIRPCSSPKAIAAGLGSGGTTMVAHLGGRVARNNGLDAAGATK
jgi:hypothetical protein